MNCASLKLSKCFAREWLSFVTGVRRVIRESWEGCKQHVKLQSFLQELNYNDRKQER